MPRVSRQDMQYSLRNATVGCGVDPIGTGDVTILLWAKKDTQNTGNKWFVDNGRLIFYTDWGNNGLSFTRANTTWPVRAKIFYHGQFSHIAVSSDSSGISNFYKNGVLQGAANVAAGTPVVGTTNLKLGTNALNGSIKDVQIYNRVLSQAEIAMVMNGAMLPGCIRRFSCNEGSGTVLYDSSGNGANGTITAGTWTTETPSKLRTASSNRVAVQDMNASLYFNKASSAKLITPANLDTSTTAFTAAAWVKITDYTQYLSIFDCGGSGGFRLETGPAGELNAIVWNGAAPGTVVAAAYDVNKWIPVILTLSSGVLSIYVNGTVAGTVSGQTKTATTTAIGIGSRYGGAQYLNGFIKNAVFYNNYAFTPSDVAAFAGGTLPSGATFNYLLNEGAGTIAYDSSGNGNNGTITAGTWSSDVPSKKRDVVGGNMVYNGDFSYTPPTLTPHTTGNSNFLDGTATGSMNSLFGVRQYNYGGTYSVGFDKTEKYNGLNSLKISTLTTNSTIGVKLAYKDGTGVAIPVSPNTSYTLSVATKTVNNSGSSTTGLRIRAVNPSSGAIGSIVVGSDTTPWTQRSIGFTTGSTASSVIIEVINIGNDGSATSIMDAWVADIQLRPTVPPSRGVAG